MDRSPSMVVNALTIDLEDWHQIAYRKLLGRSVPASDRVVQNAHVILDLLAEHNTRATFFVVGTVAEQFPGLVCRISEAGHEVATHGLAHRYAIDLGPQAFEADLRRSIDILEEIVQERVWGHRAAEFSLDGSTLWAFKIMAAAGLRYDSSLFPIRHPRYGAPTAPCHPHLIHTPAGDLVEFPLATVRLLGQNLPIAGGGYLRLLPLAFIRWGIQALNRQGQMAVVYIHPYEFEEQWLDVPVATRSARKWFNLRWRALKRNWGRGWPVQAKFKVLLRSFSFAPLREVMVHGAEWQNSGILSTACPAIRPAVSAGSPPL
jgi:polysaccharide deacetylase family protein (PEP-CTERM system associated)